MVEKENAGHEAQIVGVREAEVCLVLDSVKYI